MKWLIFLKQKLTLKQWIDKGVVEKMKFDYVHDIQQAYRKAIDCISKPGTINSLQEESQKLILPINCNKSILILMLMLLDTEVSFHILGKDGEKISKNISQLTYSPAVSLRDADFIYVLGDCQQEQLKRAIEICKIGDLVNPHLSATLIIEVEKVSNQKDLVLKGPGIKDEQYITVSIDKSWFKLRAQKNIEYPLGVDVYFVDQENNILALPRTTQISNLR